jgi:hypothetical protein
LPLKDIHAGVIEREDLRRDLVEEEAVMADGDDRSVVFVERGFECFARGMSRWFVGSSSIRTFFRE